MVHNLIYLYENNLFSLVITICQTKDLFSSNENETINSCNNINIATACEKK
jgi:hypothetical protein